MKNKPRLLFKKLKIIKKPSKINSAKANELKLIKRRILCNKSEEEKMMSALEKQKLSDLSHLFRNSQNSDIDVRWTLSLRNSRNDSNSKEFKKRILKYNNIKPPSFFHRDHENFIKKKNGKADTYDDIILPNLVTYRGLFKNNFCDTHGTILNNRSLLDFELNLRKISNRNKTKNKSFINKTLKYEKEPKWDKSISIIKKDDLNLINYSLDYDIYSKVDCLREKFVNRPFKVIFHKMKFDDKSFIFKKEYIKDKNKAFNTLGEFSSLEPYKDKYEDEKNYTPFIKAYNPKDINQSDLRYNFSLRKYKIIK